jgi:Domain of unknown function (DUF4272)
MTHALELKWRKANLAALRKNRFDPSPRLPLPSERHEGKLQLRPASEIVARLVSFRVLLMWTLYPEDVMAADRLQSYVRENHLAAYLTSLEKTILQTRREEAREIHREYVTWKFENMWSLAWVLGHEPAPTAGREMPKATLDGILARLPSNDVAEMVGIFQPHLRQADEVAGLEDLFYCALNAMSRKTALGKRSLPKWFDLDTDGPRVLERFYALSWTLSPGKKWEKVDTKVGAE